MTFTHITKLQNYQKQISITLAFMCLSLFVLYIYFISASVVHVVIRTESIQELKKVSSEIALLESRYIEAQNRVSSEIASRDGYTENVNKVFIDKSTPSFVLSNGGVR